MSQRLDLDKMRASGYSTKRSSFIQVCLCRRCSWSAKVVDDEGTLEPLKSQQERDKLAYTGRIQCSQHIPNHSKVRDCYCFAQSLDSLPFVEVPDNTGTNDNNYNLERK